MPKKKTPSKTEIDEDKILFGEKVKRCFACGQEIDSNTEVCPYCGTEI